MTMEMLHHACLLDNTTRAQNVHGSNLSHIMIAKLAAALPHLSINLMRAKLRHKYRLTNMERVCFYVKEKHTSIIRFYKLASALSTTM